MTLSLEQIVIQAIDAFLEKNGTQVDKIIADMFKAAILKKYQKSFNQEVAQGIVHAENVDKTIDYCFAELCVYLRTQQNNLSDTTKDFVINKVKEGLPQIRCIAHEILKSQGVHIIR